MHKPGLLGSSWAVINGVISREIETLVITQIRGCMTLLKPTA